MINQIYQLPPQGEVTESILYLPDRPRINMIPAMLDVTPRIGYDEQGDVAGGSPTRGKNAGIIPGFILLAFIAEVIYFVVKTFVVIR